jgi:hypothetical protein
MGAVTLPQTADGSGTMYGQHRAYSASNIVVTGAARSRDFRTANTHQSASAESTFS